MLSQRIAVQPNRDGTVIAKINFHVSAENPAGNGKPMVSKSILEMLEEGFRHWQWRGICKAGAAAPAHIGIEGKLRDRQNFSTDVQKRTIHLAFFIFEDTQVYNLVGQGFYLKLAIAIPYSKEHQEPATYLARDLLINSDTSPAYSL